MAVKLSKYFGLLNGIVLTSAKQSSCTWLYLQSPDTHKHTLERTFDFDQLVPLF